MALTLRGNGQITSDNYTIDSDGAVTATNATVNGNVIVDTNTLFVNATNNRVGIGETSPSEVFHVNGGAANVVAKFESTDGFGAIMLADNSGTAEVAAQGNDAVIMPAGTERFRVLNDGRLKQQSTISYAYATASIHSSETRYYKLINYANGYMLDGTVQIHINRNGGFNQSAAYRNYNVAVGGYSNQLYGPVTATGDGGEGGNATLYAGSDEAIYLKVTNNLYGGEATCVIIGRIRTWDYDGTYVTSAP